MAIGSLTVKSVRGAETIFANIDIANAEIRKRVNAAIQGAGILCQAEAKIHCPVDTGRLRASIQYRPGDLRCEVACDGTLVKYAWFVELGTYKMAARPFLFPAFLKAGKELKAELKQIGGKS